jgi:hypothetical protein
MRLVPVVLLIATSALAQNFYPDNFTTLPCASPNSCQSLSDSEMPSAAMKFYGLQIDMNWVAAHKGEILAALQTACKRHASCVSVPGNTYFFCDDVLSNEVRPVCNKLFPGNEQCKTYIEMWLLGIDLKWKDFWPQAQECAKKSPLTHTKPLQIWMKPAVLKPGFKGKLEFFSLDPETNLPIFATFKFDNDVVYAPANPVGLPATGYPFDYKVKFTRVPNAQGHTDLVPPNVTATAEGFDPVTFPLAAEVPKAIVSMKPAADQLHSGDNTVTVEAHDAATGKPVEMRVMLGDDIAGTTNQPITLRVGRKRPEIWVTSLFNEYNDMVVAPAK